MKNINKYIAIFSLLLLPSILVSQEYITLKNEGNEKIDSSGISIDRDTIGAYASPLTPCESDTCKVLIWVHGLGGYSGSWTRAIEATDDGAYTPDGEFFEGRQVNSVGIEYDDVGGIVGAAGILETKIRNNTNHLSDSIKNNGFLIGHSQGGLVIRTHLDKKLEDQNLDVLDLDFGGFVTFATSHAGTPIPYNTHIVKKIALDACLAISYGPILEKLDETSFDVTFLGLKLAELKASNYVNYEKIGNEIKKVCDSVGTQIVDLADKQLKGNTNYELGENSELITDINTYTTPKIKNLPKIAFTAIEDNEDIMFRTLMYQINSPNDAKYNPPTGGSIIVAFGANDDFELVDTFRRVDEWYNAKWLSYKAKLRNLENRIESRGCERWFYFRDKDFEKWECNAHFNPVIFFPFLLPHSIFNYIERKRCKDCIDMRTRLEKTEQIKDAYYLMVKWFNTNDRRWLNFIGAYDVSTEITYKCRCDLEVGEPDENSDVEETYYYDYVNQSDCENRRYPLQQKYPGMKFLCHKEEQRIVTTIIKPNDGIVLAESASALPDMTLKQGIADEDLILRDNTHMQVRNSEQLRKVLDKLYDGYFHKHFELEKD